VSPCGGLSASPSAFQFQCSSCFAQVQDRGVSQCHEKPSGAPKLLLPAGPERAQVPSAFSQPQRSLSSAPSAPPTSPSVIRGFSEQQSELIAQALSFVAEWDPVPPGARAQQQSCKPSPPSAVPSAVPSVLPSGTEASPSVVPSVTQGSAQCFSGAVLQP
jgi:hypothetical protein